jgi:hypothetical protein
VKFRGHGVSLRLVAQDGALAVPMAYPTFALRLRSPPMMQHGGFTDQVHLCR